MSCNWFLISQNEEHQSRDGNFQTNIIVNHEIIKSQIIQLDFENIFLFKQIFLTVNCRTINKQIFMSSFVRIQLNKQNIQ